MNTIPELPGGFERVDDACGKVWHADALALLRALPENSIDLVLTDPPYNGVKDDAWDNQWTSDKHFLEWLGVHLKEMRRVLKPNGSLYLCASPRLGARVEVLTSEYFNVLNNIRWQKPRFSTIAEKFDKATMRAYFPSSETIIFAEQCGADTAYQGALIDENSSYWDACQSAKSTIIGDYLAAEFDRAGVTRKEIAALFPSVTGNLTGCVSNWLLGHNIPTKQQYEKMRACLNAKGGEYLRREYEELRREYEELRREYEELRREYEYLRRPFYLNDYMPYTDVWTFSTVQAYDGKHPTEKPLALIEHMVKASSREGAIILDPFAGSGTTAVAARNLNRRYIVGDITAEYVQLAEKRLAQPYTPNMFETLLNASSE